MNKKFFTLMAAVLIGGAAMPSDAFAQVANVDLKTDSIALDGAKFFMGTSAALWSVKDSASTNYAVLNKHDVTDRAKAAVFEVKNFNKSNSTFELWVNGKQLAEKRGNKVYTTFYARKSDDSVADSTNFTHIHAAVMGDKGADIFRESGAQAYSQSNQHDAESLNSYLKPGVKFSFPDAVNLEENPLADRMVALKMSEANVHSAFAGCNATPTDSVALVLKDAAYDKYAAKASKTEDDLKTLSFAVVDSFSTYGITGMTDMEGHPIKFVKGDKLALTANKAKGIHKQDVAKFWFAEGDSLNAYGQLQITAKISGIDYKIGAYSLTAGGLKSYVTAVKEDKELASYAQIGGGTFADTKALIKADGKSVYNLFFTGDLSADKGKESWSYFGKYFINSAKKGGKEVVAPKDAVLDVADAQWVVKSVGVKGDITLSNMRTFATDTTMTLYATNEPYLYELATPVTDATHVRFVPVTEDNTYTTFTDEELAKNIELSFKGSGAISVNNIYVSYGKNAAYNDEKMFQGTQDPKSSFKGFKLAKGTQVMKGYSYAYINGENVASKTDSLAVQAYTITAQFGDSIKNIAFREDHKLDSIKYVAGSTEKPMQLVFKKNADGHLHALSFSREVENHAKVSTEHLFTDSISANTANVLKVNSQTAAIDTVNVEGAADYCNLVYEFVGEKGTSLPAEPQYATFAGKDGAIAWKQNGDALEGVLAENPLLFRLDTADTGNKVPSFYISKAALVDEETEVRATEPDREMLFNPARYLQYWDEQSASWKDREGMTLTDGNTKAFFLKAAVTGINEAIRYNEEGAIVDATADDVKALKFTITEATEEGDYWIQSKLDDSYLYSLNGKLGFTADEDKALAVAVAEGEPTANEAIAAEAEVAVIAGNGTVTVQGAAGKVITVANILGQTIANQVAASDNVTIAAPAGVVVVTVDGEATKVVVK